MFKNVIGSPRQTDIYALLKLNLTSQSNLVKTDVDMGSLMLNILRDGNKVIYMNQQI